MKQASVWSSFDYASQNILWFWHGWITSFKHCIRIGKCYGSYILHVLFAHFDTHRNYDMPMWWCHAKSVQYVDSQTGPIGVKL